MAKKRKQSRSTSNKRKGAGVAPASRLAAIEKKVALLDRSMRTPFHVRRHALALGTADAFEDSSVALTQVREIGFEKSDDSPDLVRITLDNLEEVVSPGDKNGTSLPRPVGTFVTALVEVIGNGGQTATIAVKNAAPDKIMITIPVGQNQTFGTKPLLVR